MGSGTHPSGYGPMFGCSTQELIAGLAGKTVSSPEGESISQKREGGLVRLPINTTTNQETHFISTMKAYLSSLKPGNKLHSKSSLFRVLSE